MEDKTNFFKDTSALQYSSKDIGKYWPLAKNSKAKSHDCSFFIFDDGEIKLPWDHISKETSSLQKNLVQYDTKGIFADLWLK